MSYPDNFNRRAFDARFGSYREGDPHNDVLERWAREIAGEMTRAVTDRYVAKFGPDAPLDVTELFDAIEAAIYDAGFEA